MMKKEELQAIAQSAAKNIKTEEDLKEFKQTLTKITLEAALNAELDEHLGYAKHEKPVQTIAVTAIPAKPFKRKKVNLNWIPRETETVILSPKSSKRINAVLFQ